MPGKPGAYRGCLGWSLLSVQITTAWEAGVAVSFWFHVEEEWRGSLLVPRAGAAGSLLLPSSGHLPCCKLLQQCPGEQGRSQPGQGEGQPGAGIACGR